MRTISLRGENLEAVYPQPYLQSSSFCHTSFHCFFSLYEGSHKGKNQAFINTFLINDFRSNPFRLASLSFSVLKFQVDRVRLKDVHNRSVMTVLHWVPLCIYMGVIFYFSSGEHRVALPTPDYVLHFLEYIPLGFLIARAIHFSIQGRSP